MSAERLAKIPEADLDPNGVFKYVLIRVHSEDDDSYVDIVRGYAWAEYHGKDAFICLDEWQERQVEECARLLTTRAIGFGYVRKYI